MMLISDFQPCQVPDGPIRSLRLQICGELALHTLFRSSSQLNQACDLVHKHCLLNISVVGSQALRAEVLQIVFQFKNFLIINIKNSILLSLFSLRDSSEHDVANFVYIINLLVPVLLFLGLQTSMDLNDNSTPLLKKFSNFR